MGAEASKPKPGATVKVIGAGLPRTGTASFCAALLILLQGPVYHSGTQMLVSGDERHIKTQINILKRTPIKSTTDKTFVLSKLKELTDGYVATADSSMCQFVPELLELYPEAIVICTIRDTDAWAQRMGKLVDTSLQAVLSLILFWVPCLRYFPRWVRILHEGRWGEIYIKPGEKPSYGRLTWERHHQWLQENVPRDRLMYYDVRDGWEPLCAMLGVPVPDSPFPSINDSEAMDGFARQQIRRGLMRWSIVVMVMSSVVAVTLRSGYLWSLE